MDLFNYDCSGTVLEYCRQVILGRISYNDNKKVMVRLRNTVWNYKHKNKSENRERLNCDDVTIISTNCTGGILYHDLGLEFKSPTVNLFFVHRIL